MRKKTSRCILFFCMAAAMMIFFACKNSADEKTLMQYTRAKDLYAQGRFSESSKMLKETLHFAPALSLRAKAEYFSGDLDNAEKFFRRAIKKRSTAFEAKLYLARIYREKGEMQKAEKIAYDLLSDNPFDLRTLYFASGLAKEQGKIREAQVLLNQAAELSADSAMVLFERANMHWQAGRTSQAKEDLKRANAMLPWDTPLAKSIKQLELLLEEEQ